MPNACEHMSAVQHAEFSSQLSAVVTDTVYLVVAGVSVPVVFRSVRVVGSMISYHLLLIDGLVLERLRHTWFDEGQTCPSSSIPPRLSLEICGCLGLMNKTPNT
jgi:hypothetical protein